MAGSSTETPAFLDTVEGEISFFRSIMRARPVGMNRHFHILTMRTSIQKDTGHWVAVEEIWQKLKSCYDIEALDAIDVEAEGYELANKSLISITPSTDDNLMAHPFFRDEFSLPPEPSFEGIISSRRVNTAPSPPSSPETSAAASPSTRAKLSRPKKRNEKSKASMAGLVGGESDSSDLTDSGEDDHAPSVVTATDGGETVDGDPEEDAEMQDVTADTSVTATKAGRSRKSTAKKTASTRVRTAAASSTSRPKKRKR